MKTSSCKAKGREFQNKIRDMYRLIGQQASLVSGDIEGRPMGQAGTDIIFSPAAIKVFNHAIECKKHRRAAVPTLFEEHHAKYKGKGWELILLFHENDRSNTLVTMKASDLMTLLNKILELEGE